MMTGIKALRSLKSRAIGKSNYSMNKRRVKQLIELVLRQCVFINVNIYAISKIFGG
jgi:hypothetical protein